MAIRLKDKLKLSDGLNTTSSIDAGTMDLSGILTLSKSNGSLISTSNTTDAFGYNATAGKGHYIKGTAATYVYGGGKFYDGSTTHTLLHDGSTISTDQISNLSGTNTGDQDLSGYALTGAIPTDFVSAANGGTFAGTVKLDAELQFNRGSSDYSDYIRAQNYPSEGYTSSTGKYWLEYGAKGGHHFVLNTDGGSGSAENAMDDFTIWNGAVDGDRLLEVTNAGNTSIYGSISATGGATVTGTSTFNGNIDVNGNADISGNITLSGGGARIIQSGGDIALKTNHGLYALYGAANGNTNIYYNGVQKFRTGPNGVVVTGDIEATGNLFLGEDGGDPQIDMMYTDHASGDAWDTRIFIGKSDNLPGGSTTFPTYTPAGAYGIQFQANSDGAFFGMEEYTTGHYRPIIQWGDDNTDTPFRIKHENGSELEVSWDGNVTATTSFIAPTLSSTVATGTAPLTVTSTTKVTNLNAHYFDGASTSYFLNTSSTGQTKTGALDVGTLKVDGKKVLDLPSNAGSERGPWNPIVSSIRGSGKTIHIDEEFLSGNNGVNVYNNSGGTGVVITRETDDTTLGATAPNDSGYVLKIVHNGNVTSPGHGGFVQNIPSEDNHTFVQIFQAKLDTGRSLVLAENAQGSNNASYWLTNTAGTGKWEWYARVSHCGDSGTFHGGGHVYVTGGTSSFTWYLASCTLIDVTDASGDYLRLSGGVMKGNAHFTDPSTAGTSAKLQFGTETSWNNNIGLESYWMVLGSNQNEGFKFKDSTGNMLLQLNGGNSASGNGTLSSTFGGSLTATFLTASNSNGAANGTAQEMARIVNIATGATSSYIYIGASSGTDWRVGKNINGTAGNTNFGITKHSGTDLFLEIDGSGNTSIHGNLTSGGSLTAAGNLYLGSTGTENFIAFKGTTGDSTAGYTTTYIGEYLYGGTEQSELILYKGNDGQVSTASPDRIRLIGANLCFDVYNVAQTYPTTMAGVAGLTTTRAMTILANGDVGIGTTTPQGKLDVRAGSGGKIILGSYDANYNVTIQGGNQIDFYNGATAANGYINYLGSGTGLSQNLFVEKGNVGTAGNVRIDSSGQVGIGTTSPSEKLEVAGKILSKYGSSTNHAVIEHKDNANNVIFSFRRSDGAGGNGNDLVIRAYEDIHLAPNNSDTSKFVVKADGNVGIGILNPEAKLDIAGGINATGINFLNQSNQYNNPTPGVTGFGNKSMDTSISYYDTGKTVATSTRGIVWTGKHYILTDYNAQTAKFYDSNFDTMNRPTGGTINLPNHGNTDHPHGAAWDGRYLYCIQYGGSGAKIVAYDLDNGTTTASILFTKDLNNSSSTYDVEYAEGHLYTVTDGAVSKYKLEGNTISHVHTSGNILSSLEAQSITYDGSYLWITQNGNNMYQVRLDCTLKATLTTSIPPENVAMAWNGQNTISVNHTNGKVYVINTAHTRFDTEQFSIMGGNVGIGTTTPATKLDVRITTSNRTTLEPVLTVSAQGNGPYTGFGPKISFNSNIYYSATTAGNIETAYIGAVMGPTYETYSDLVFGTRQNATTVDEKMRITGGGYVGIGGVPKAWLHIKKTQSYGSLRISPTSNNGESAMAFFTDAAGTQTSTAWVVGHAGWANTGDFVIGNQAFGGPIMLIQQDGNTGIGSTSPGAKLDVVGNVRTSTYYNFHGNPAVPTDTTAAIFDQTSIGPTISGLNVTFRAGTPTPAEVMRIDDSGNVGIGTTSPGYKLEVDGTGLFTGVLVLKGQASNYDATTGRTTYWDYDDKVALALEPAADDGAVAIFFKSIGNAPSDFGYIAFDEDYGEAGVTAGENSALVIGCENDGAGSSDHVRVKGRLVVEADMSSSDPAKAFQVKSSNTTSDLFHINRGGGGYLSGTLNVTGDVVAYYSDMRLKTKLEDLTGAVSKIKMLNSFYYEPNEKALELGYKKERRIGLSAQEVQEVLPEAVSKASISHDPKVEEDYLSVDYAKLVPLLVEGIKELKAEIEELKKQIK